MKQLAIKHWIESNFDFLLKRLKGADPKSWTLDQVKSVMDENIDKFEEEHKMKEILLHKDF